MLLDEKLIIFYDLIKTRALSIIPSKSDKILLQDRKPNDMGARISGCK